MADVSYKGFAGLKNTAGAERLEPGDLVSALNVDIDDTGRLTRRDGYAKLSAVASHSLWSDDRICLVVQGGDLKRVHENYTTTTLRAGVGDTPMSYVSVNGRVYYSNAVVTGIIDESGAARSWGLPVPRLSAATNAGGMLAPGVYQFVWTYVREDGQESGADLAGQVVVTTGGIEFTDIPVSDDPTVTHKILYVTPQNGDVLYRAAAIENADTSFTYAGGHLAVPLDTQFLQAPPACDIVAYHYGTLYAVQGEFVFPSGPFGYELFDLREFIRLDGPVQIFAPVEGGIWVGTQEKIFWLEGAEPNKMKLSLRAETGSVKGTLAYLNSSDLPDINMPDLVVAVWWTHDGVVAGYPGGILKNLTEDRYLPSIKGERGAGLVRETGNGTKYMAIIEH